MKKQNKESPFGIIIDNMLQQESLDEELELYMNLSTTSSKKLSARYKIIALGFIHGLTLEEVNKRLNNIGYPNLYARNFWDATLIYSFKNGLKYNEWKVLKEKSLDFYYKIRDKKEFDFTVSELENYVDKYSEKTGYENVTKALTKSMETTIKGLNSETDFIKYISDNIESFSRVREKTRYYFCKYMLYYLYNIIDDILSSKNIKEMSVYERNDFRIFRSISKLDRRKSLDKNEKRLILRNSKLSPAALFNEFNNYYFNWITKDWLNILIDDFEYYAADDLIYVGDDTEKIKIPKENILKKLKKLLVSSKKYTESEIKKMRDEDVIYAALELFDSDDTVSREGEKQLRRIIKGEVDINRTCLICYILFFSLDSQGKTRNNIPDKNKINKKRIDKIIVECGYTGLSVNDSVFDKFILDYIRISNPQKLLQKLAVNYMNKEENMPIFKVYTGLESYNKSQENYFLYK